MYGLHSNWYIDDRMDPEEATAASSETGVQVYFERDETRSTETIFAIRSTLQPAAQ